MELNHACDTVGKKKKRIFLLLGIAVVICAFWAVYIVILFRFHFTFNEFSLVILERILHNHVVYIFF